MLDCPKGHIAPAACLTCLLSIALTLFQIPARSQTLPNATGFRHLGTSDGLSEGRITCILQDTKGFIWIGTYYGLNKYDGYSFKHFYARPQDSSGLQNSVITSLCEDSAHSIWIGTQGGGVSSLDRRTGKFHHYGYDSTNLLSLSSNYVTSLLCDSKGRLWAGTLEDGLNCFDRETGSWWRYAFLQRGIGGGSPNNVRSLFESASGTIIVNASGAPIEFDPRACSSRLLTAPQAFPNSSIGSIWPLASSPYYLYQGASKNERIRLFCSGALPLVEPTQRWGSLKLSGSIYFVLQEPSEIEERVGTCMTVMGTSNGLFVMDPEECSINPLNVNTHELGNSYDNCFTCGLFDRQRRLWIGSFNGLYVLNKDALIFRKHTLQSDSYMASMKPQTVRSLHVNRQGKLLAGMLSGQLFELSKNDNEFHLSKRHIITRPGAGLAPLNGIAEDPLGNTWFAVSSGPCLLQSVGKLGLVPITTRTSPRELLAASRYFHPHAAPDFLPPGESGYVVYCDRESRIWLGCATKKERAATLLCYDTRSDSIFSYVYPGSEVGRSGLHGVYAILEDHNSNFWIGGAEGLFQLDRVTGKFKSFLNNPADDRTLSYNSVATLYEDSRGRLWIGTWGGGLNLMDSKSGQFTRFLEQDGLPSNIIYSILEDKTGSLWMTTGRGISHFNANLKTFSNYDLDDGLLDTEFQPNASAMLPSGEMFFGGNHGVTSFFPDQVIQKDRGAPLAVTSFNVSNKLYASELEDGDTVLLDYNQNYLSFEFASLDFSSPAKNRYAYMLQNGDDRWLQCANRNSGAYNNLSPGHYILRIKSANVQGVWDAPGIAINIFIAAPYWGTRWFQILVALCLSALILAWVLRIHARDRAYQVMLDHALENERINLAGELHDGPLQDLYATRFLLEGTAEETSAFGQNPTSELEAILKKVRGDLRAVTGELQLPHFENGLAQELSQFLESFGEHNPEIRIASEIQPEPDSLPLKVQQNLFRIFRTALANVKRHSDAGEVSVRFTREGRMFSLEIVDDGRGFEVPSILDALRRGKHYGLILMYAYANEIGAKLSISSTPRKITRIRVIYLTPRTFWTRSVRFREQKA